MASSDSDSDEFSDKGGTINYSNGFSQDNWEEEFEKVPMFMKSLPENIDPLEYPELACIQSIVHSEDRSPEEQARSLKDEGNEFFREKNYRKAVQCYTAGLQKKSGERDTNTLLLTNRAAAHFHLGNMRSALNDAAAAKQIKPEHVKALIRGAQCCMELRLFPEAVQWCDEGLKVQPTDRKLQELRAGAEKHRRAAERDARKAKAKEKKLQEEREALLAAIEARGIKLLRSAASRTSHGEEEEEEEEGEGPPAARPQLRLDDLVSQEATGARVSLDQEGALHWPVLFLYPEHQQSDFVSAFCESSCFVDHLSVMFGEELPPWDEDRKYVPQNLQLYFEDEETETLHQVDPETPLLHVLQHQRFFVKAGSPSFIVLVTGSSFRKQFVTGKKIRGL